MLNVKRATAVLLVAGAVSTLAPVKPANAAALTFNQATITTTIIVPNVCSFLTNQAYTAKFTSYDPINANATTAPTAVPVALQYVCTNGDATDKFTFDGGGSYSGSSRRAKGTASTANYINYNLYTDSGASNAIGLGGSVSASVGTGYVPGTPLTTTVYVGVPAGQATVTADTYTDIVTVTINP